MPDTASNNQQRLEQLKAFYTAGAANDRGYTLFDLWSKPDSWLERNHMFIQWMFPLTTASAGNMYAPVLDDPTINFLRNNASAQDNLVRSFVRFCALLGLKVINTEQGPQLAVGDNFAERKTDWFTFDSHNNARITRVLTSLSLLGRDDLARVLFDGLLAVMADEPGCGIGEYAVERWRAAMGNVADRLNR
ncbi:opioid growth factor receptor-related protein [Pseudidiomarina sp. PP-1MA]|uniref:Opioid growth factor receptor-related protein n=1 Tax=Pseudidiomarina sp. PP-1MA TaxID=3237706 RepID=A0AB39XCQ1_9GAMM